MYKTYIQKATDPKKDITSIYGITNKHFPDIQLELKELFKRDWADRQGDQEYIPSSAMFKAYEQDMEFVCLDAGSPIDAAKKIKTFLKYLMGSEFSFYSEYHKRGFRCRYVSYDSKAFYREAQEAVVFNIRVKINNPLTYVVFPVPSIIYTAEPDDKIYWWYGMSVNKNNGDVYISSHGNGIYKQSGGSGNFVNLGVIPANAQWTSISVNPNNMDVYVCGYYVDIYKQTAGSGDFVSINTGLTVTWQSVFVNPVNGDVYACAYDGDVYKQTAGVGSFSPLNATGTNKHWFAVCVNPTNGDVYACDRGDEIAALGGDIYKQIAGAGSFVALNATGSTKTWGAITVNPVSGDVYAGVDDGDIYKQTAGTGSFVALNATGANKNWLGIAVNPNNGDVYACDTVHDIYKQTAGTGSFTAIPLHAVTQSNGFKISFTTNSATDAYWDDGTSNTYNPDILVEKVFDNTDHFGIISPQKL